ncbi:hypothetical protein LEP1GSC194_1588 [Leptospira alstonii serovar Sichuan str. 79601]|uniref:Uncharacterized protein n=1 Tax=Leptospira alstonii serovar Sichuan str. 79601 TaxID=1218565 RepID=M6D5M7_9LEPT|nr:hypothetical protein LEP1GSC194_1588 [Leptospira alstonii serovar Sichuan str. 79601]
MKEPRKNCQLGKAAYVSFTKSSFQNRVSDRGGVKKLKLEKKNIIKVI